MSDLPPAAMDAMTDAVLIFGILFLIALLGGWWARARRKPARRLPCQHDVDDFARIYRS